MTHIYNEERGFKDEFLEGLAAAYGRFLVPIPGASGVMSVAAPTPGRVSTLIGGGSGHYPAFAGLVGPGLSDGAIVGNIFTSPSAEQAYRCIRKLDGGAGVLLLFGNYSGDVMHFGLAVERARAEGIDARVVLVTDDVASRPSDQASERRGIAGGFFVFRAAAAAAHEGRSIDAVEELARRVNRATFTFGVAFGGCTFPGRAEPLFSVEPGQIELGLGIHGEPGIATVAWMPADQLADVMVDRVLAERPAGATRAHLLLNGLGATKYEELFVLYRAISRRLDREGVEIVDPEVGEFVTSLDMAGCSLSLCWNDEEVGRLLGAPAAAPGFRMSGPTGPAGTSGGVDQARTTAGRSRLVPVAEPPPPPTPSPGKALTPTTPGARSATAALAAIAERMSAMESELGRLDSIAGDGDHGAGMARGTAAAAAAAASAGPGLADVLHAAALAFSDVAGGASGALWGVGLLAMASTIRARGETDPSDTQSTHIDQATLQAALTAGLEAVTRLGGAAPGDKTMVDALGPFIEAFGATADSTIVAAWSRAVTAADQAADATAGLGARRGRAAVHGDQSIGTPDPGAISFAAAMAAAGESLSRTCR